jgi:hypothetical protein
LAQSFGTLDPKVTTLIRLGGVEGVAAQSIRERGDSTPPIHLCLSAFGLQLVEDTRQCRRLGLIEIELVDEEPERPAHAKGAAGTETFLAFTGIMGMAAGPGPEAAELTESTLGVPPRTTTCKHD